MYNIQKAVGRLDFAPKLTEIQITDFQKGLGVFTPKPNKSVSFAALKETLKKAGYTLDAADITVKGTLAKGDGGWSIVAKETKQTFLLQGANAHQVIGGATAGDPIEITGDWKTLGTGPKEQEVITPSAKSLSNSQWKYRQPIFVVPVNFIEPNSLFINGSEALVAEPGKPAAPIRVTSPGLTVYKGGAVTPRVYLIKQHLGSLDVNRQLVHVSVSYTPSPKLQLEIETPFSRTAYDNGVTSGSGTGIGNILGWAKYRFFRKVKTYGDRQAAVRLGLELPTGKKETSTQTQVSASAFVRQQLSPINGGFSPHFDLAFSQAGGRVIFGGNAEIIFRSERDGFRMGHEQRLNTDLEYVIPHDPHKPGGELFLILETTFVHRGTGRLDGLAVSGSKATEYYLAPGLQYAARPRFVIEGSFQFPVVRNTGPQILRTDRNILLGVKYLF